MIDYTKILLEDMDIERLLNLPQLEFKFEVSDTGEYSTKKIADYHFCKIVVHESGIVLFTGSIHKMWNSLNNIKAPNFKKLKFYKGFNGNQFVINDIIKVRIHLQALFNCHAKQMVFQNIEFGINTSPHFNPRKYLKGLLYHRNKLFEYKFNRNFAQSIHQRFILKIYNKSGQYEMDYNVLRVELKIIKSLELEEIGIVSFKDINRVTLDRAKDLVLKRFDEVMHYDSSIQKNRLSSRSRRLLENYSNSHYWIDQLQSNHRDRHKKRLKEITLNYSDNIHLKVREEIINKCVIINSK